VSPDERLTIDELVDIELERLGCADIGRVEIDVVGEIVDIGTIEWPVSGKPCEEKSPMR